MLRIRKLDTYVTFTFLGPFALCLVGFAGLFVVVDLFANIDEFFGQRPVFEALRVAAVYYALRLPSLLARIMPIFTVLPAVICVLRLLRSNEMCAMRASGVSERRIVLPVLYCCGVVTLLAAANQELLVPALHGAFIRAERRARKPTEEGVRQALLDDGQGRLLLVGTYHPKTPLPTLTKVRIGWDDKARVHHTKKADRAFTPELGPTWYMENVWQFDGKRDLMRRRVWEPREPERFVSHGTAELLEKYRTAGDRVNVPLIANDTEPLPVAYEFGGYTENDEAWPVARDVIVSHPVEADVRIDMMVWVQDRWLTFGVWKLEAADTATGANFVPARADGRKLMCAIKPSDIEEAGNFKGGSSAKYLSELIAVSARFGEHSTFRQRCWVMVWNRIAFPLANILLAMLTLPLVFRRDAHAALVGISLAAVMTFAFIVTNVISIDLAYRQWFVWAWPAFGGLFPVGLFACVAGWLFSKMGRV